MSDEQRLQMVVGEVQNARQQVASLSAQIKEITQTITAIQQHPADAALHRQMGAVLIEVTDRDELVRDLENTNQRMSEALITIREREAELVSAYETLKQNLGE
jgi:chaperonin cofactor prefoldin